MTMLKLMTGTFVALALVAGSALAQTATPTAATADAAVAAKFKAADKNGNGSLDGAELDAYKADLAKIDTDKDGKISLAEFQAASKSGVVKYSASLVLRDGRAAQQRGRFPFREPPGISASRRSAWSQPAASAGR